MTVVDREALLEKLKGEIDSTNQRIKVIAARRAADGIALSELRCERVRLERHRASLLRNGEGRL